MVECWSYEPKVAGSIPAWSIIMLQHVQSILGRVVKALDLSPSGLSPRGFEPRRMHFTLFFLCKDNNTKLIYFIIDYLLLF